VVTPNNNYTITATTRVDLNCLYYIHVRFTTRKVYYTLPVIYIIYSDGSAFRTLETRARISRRICIFFGVNVYYTYRYVEWSKWNIIPFHNTQCTSGQIYNMRHFFCIFIRFFVLFCKFRVLSPIRTHIRSFIFWDRIINYNEFSTL